MFESIDYPSASAAALRAVDMNDTAALRQIFSSGGFFSGRSAKKIDRYLAENPSSPGTCLLHRAIDRDNQPMAAFLFSCGASWTAQERAGGKTPLQRCIEKEWALAEAIAGEKSILGDLFEPRDAQGRGYAHWICSELNPVAASLAAAYASAATRFTGEGASQNHFKALNVSDRKGQTPLMAAAAAGALSQIRSFAEAGASLDAKDLQGQTALHLAAAYGRADAAALLLRFGANPEIADLGGQTPLAIAQSLGNPCAEAIQSHILLEDERRRQEAEHKKNNPSPAAALWAGFGAAVKKAVQGIEAAPAPQPAGEEPPVSDASRASRESLAKILGRQPCAKDAFALFEIAKAPSEDEAGALWRALLANDRPPLWNERMAELPAEQWIRAEAIALHAAEAFSPSEPKRPKAF